MINVNQITSKLAMMPDGALKQFAEMHKEDPYSFSLAIAESNRRKQIRTQVPPMQEQPKVADQELSAMTRPPEEVGIGALPVDMNMASGGIVAFGPGGQAKEAPVPSFDSALDIEGIDDPQQRAFLKAIYSQESSSGKNTKTSNRGAVGGMQILKSTFDSVADEGMDIKNPLDNMRVGIRYASAGYEKANGNPVLAGAYYYGGPGGMRKAAKGIAVSDPKNPNAPTTIDYGKSIADKMTAFLPMSSAQAETVQPPAAPSDVDRRSVSGQLKSIGQGLERLKNRFTTGDSEPQAAPQQVAGNETDSSSRIPSYTPPAGFVGRPAEDDRSIFTRAGDALLIPRSVQDDIYKLTAPLSGSVGAVPRLLKAAPSTSKAFEKALEAHPEAVAAAATATAAAAKKASPSNILVNMPKGLEALTPEAQQLRMAALNARTARAANEAKTSAAAAQKTVDEANVFQKGLGLEVTAIDAEKAAKVARANKIINTGRAVPAVDTTISGVEDRFFGGKDGNKAPKETAAQKAVTEKSNASMQAIQEAEDADILATRRLAAKAEDLSKREKKEVIDLAKDNAPDSAKTKGFNNDDWLQFGLALMAGTSRYALQNVGTAGMSALAGKKEREKEERAIMSKMMDKTDMTKVIERLMKEDPKLTYKEAYQIFQDGRTAAIQRERDLGIKQQGADIDRATAIAKGMAKLDETYPPTIRSSDSPYGKKMAADYAAAVAALQSQFPPITGGAVAPAAPAAGTMPLPGAKIVGSRPA